MRKIEFMQTEIVTNIGWLTWLVEPEFDPLKYQVYRVEKDWESYKFSLKDVVIWMSGAIAHIPNAGYADIAIIDAIPDDVPMSPDDFNCLLIYNKNAPNCAREDFINLSSFAAEEVEPQWVSQWGAIAYYHA